MLYLLGLLNSRLLTFRFRTIGKLKGGGIYEYFWNSCLETSIRRIDLSKPADKTAHDRMVTLVDSMLGLHKQLAGAQSAAQKAILQRQIDSTDAEIRLVYDLYGLTEEEIAIVEGTTPSEPRQSV